MQAIVTKIIPATNTKGTRIKAFCERGAIVVGAPYNNRLDSAECHAEVAAMLCDKFAKEDLREYGTTLANNPWKRPFVSGGLPGSWASYAHVFTA